MAEVLQNLSKNMMASVGRADMAIRIRDRRYHALHETSHGVVGIAKGLTVKEMKVGKTSTGTNGSTSFCNRRALRRDPWRFLLIAVAGKVGTRLMGYSNRLVSINLLRLKGEEPGWASDEHRVWSEGATLAQIQGAEAEAQYLLQRRYELWLELTEALLVNGQLTKHEIHQLVRKL